MYQSKFQILSTKMLDKILIPAAFNIDEIPFIEIKDTKEESVIKKIQQLSSQKITTVFTSSNAVKVVEKYISIKPEWKIFCIGNKTKETVLKFFNAECIADTAYKASDLAWKIMKDISAKSIIFFCGQDRRDDLPEILIQNGIDVEEIIVYQTIKKPVLINNKYDGILFFSPSAVESFFLLNKINEHSVCFAIGDTTAAAIKNFTSSTIITAKNPMQESLVDSLKTYFKI